MLKSKNNIVINSNELQLIGEFELHTSSISNKTHERVTEIKIVNSFGKIVYQSGNNLSISVENIEKIENEIIHALDNSFLQLLDELFYNCNYQTFEMRVKNHKQRLYNEEKDQTLKTINAENKALRNELQDMIDNDKYIVIEKYDQINLYEKTDKRVTKNILDYAIENNLVKLLLTLHEDQTKYNTSNEVWNNNLKAMKEYIQINLIQ
ncbi:hypothetical protein [Terrisporobacter sp.]|uniref:hypothetical protein n=1 Tax=Terrisporobacter sp. TaxID=1965305 RepID=UPI00289C9FDC|nr:hypothetical protein [Terrisporobacter sp.]